MALTVEERRLIARACRSLAHIVRKDLEKQPWQGVRGAMEEQVRMLDDLVERMERGLPPVT